MRILSRVLLLTILALAAFVGLTALDQWPGSSPVLPARTGPALADAKSWGYQLQRFNAGKVPSELDVLVIDYSRDGTRSRALSAADTEALRTRPDGSRRIVLAYLSIGEAENYRAYWRRRWAAFPPSWLGPENTAWKGNFPVRYWDPAWQKIIVDPARASRTLWDRVIAAIFDEPQPFLDQIIEAGFDGVYLDRVDAYEKPLDQRPSPKTDMVAFVEKISAYAKARRPGFLIVPQNGEALLADDHYRRLIDGIGKEDLLFGEGGDGVANNPVEVRYTINQLNRLKSEGRPVFVVEYLSDDPGRESAAAELRKLGFVPVFAERGLKLPPVLPKQVVPKPQTGAASVPLKSEADLRSPPSKPAP